MKDSTKYSTLNALAILAMPALLVTWVVLSVLLTIRFVSVNNDVYADIGAKLDRAATTPDAEQIAAFLSEAQDGMVKHGVTEGHAALVLENDQNDVGIGYDILNRLQGRAEQVATLSGVEYGIALANLQRQVATVETHEQGYFHRQHPQYILGVTMSWGVGLVATVVGIVILWHIADAAADAARRKRWDEESPAQRI